MEWNETLYKLEVEQLIDRAVDLLLQDHSSIHIYTVSIWTDPDAAISALSIDTEEHSKSHVESHGAYNAKQRKYWLDAGDEEMANLFNNELDRCRNPADFELRNLVKCEHQAFEPLWAERTEGQCWDVLEPALLQIADYAVERFNKLRLADDAMLGVNSRRDWFDHTHALPAASA
ncbi:MAG: hypothetical protein GC159_18125 [Phycisphaera sp.]|nr:hypothetical protein [Phycisphaera sp.]